MTFPTSPFCTCLTEICINRAQTLLFLSMPQALWVCKEERRKTKDMLLNTAEKNRVTCKFVKCGKVITVTSYPEHCEELESVLRALGGQQTHVKHTLKCRVPES